MAEADCPTARPLPGPLVPLVPLVACGLCRPPRPGAGGGAEPPVGPPRPPSTSLSTWEPPGRKPPMDRTQPPRQRGPHGWDRPPRRGTFPPRAGEAGSRGSTPTPTLRGTPGRAATAARPEAAGEAERLEPAHPGSAADAPDPLACRPGPSALAGPPRGHEGPPCAGCRPQGGVRVQQGLLPHARFAHAHTGRYTTSCVHPPAPVSPCEAVFCCEPCGLEHTGAAPAGPRPALCGRADAGNARPP